MNVSVPPLNNSVLKESDELNTTTNDYFIKCPQCQKGCQTFQALKEHMESNHQDLAVTEHGPLSISSAVSPTPPTTVVGGPFGCTQCTTSFSSKDQLEKHELLHSPNANVVSVHFFVIVLNLLNNFNIIIIMLEFLYYMQVFDFVEKHLKVPLWRQFCSTIL